MHFETNICCSPRSLIVPYLRVVIMNFCCSFFGQAFEQVAEKTGCSLFNDYFDSTGMYFTFRDVFECDSLFYMLILQRFECFLVVRVAVGDRPKVFDALAVLLS